ncbi:MAG: hypothetical protein IKW83_09340 [Muribaculaceae bacterium]|nr:hypothetical protein [Muribaculaceae bacterium]
MKCINCYREIDDGLKFCPKCGFMQPEDRVAYELEHPELAEAMPEDEILKNMNLMDEVPRTAMSRDEFVQLIASDPHCDSIVNIADEGVATYGLVEPSAVETWYAKCAELIRDKQGFYPYFMKLLSQQPEKARKLLTGQVAEDMSLVLPSQEVDRNLQPQIEPQFTESGEAIPPLPPALPAAPPAPPTAVTPSLQEAGAAAQPASLRTHQLSDSVNTVECPICHQLIHYGMRQCPYCKQLLDWSYTSFQTEEQEVSEKTKRGALWILLAVLLALLIGGAGLYIYTSVKDKTHISKNDDSDEPTGNLRKDAKQYINELIYLMENADISTKDDYNDYQDDLKDLQEKYEDYYKDLGDDSLEEFTKECYNVLGDSYIKEKFEKAYERIENQRRYLY